jgi:S-DNA-T family DNA segregation ATPase FtsK/SpoIIIE
MPLRVHGAFVSDQEVHRVVTHLKGGGAPAYLDEITEGPAAGFPGMPGEMAQSDEAEGEADALYDQAVRIVCETRRASVSGIQRRLKIGYNRAARLVESMEAAGLVGQLQSNGFREVLAPPPPEND